MVVIRSHPRARSARRKGQVAGISRNLWRTGGGGLRMSLDNMLRGFVKGEGCRDVSGRRLATSNRGCRDDHALLGLVRGWGGASASPRARDLDN